jgi:predicted anti-sigma-YlaC factor YlaD
MNWSGCSQLEEVRTALRRGQWADGCPAELVKHVEGCATCRQEVLVTSHLQRVRAAAVQAAPLLPPGLLWWRAQARRRELALTRAARPLAAAQVFAFVVVAAAVLALIAAHWSTLLDVPAQLGSVSIERIKADWGMAPIAFALTLISTLGGVVVFLTTQRQR